MNKIALVGFVFLALISCKKESLEEKFIREQTEEINLKQDSDKIPKTQLAIDNPDFDFGNIKHGDAVEHTYEITNTGNEPLIISMVKPTCGCTIPDFTTDPILPKAKGKVTLKFDSNNFPNQTIVKTALLYCNIGKSPIELRFKAVVSK